MPDPDRKWSVIVHGGARSIPSSDHDLFREGCLEAASAAATILRAGGSALGAVEAAVRLLEDLPNYNAGHGSVRNADGDIEMDAAIMDGESLALGAVGAIKDVRHPISVARAMLGTIPTLLVGEGARRFAHSIDAEPARPAAASSPDPGCDTVGCIARDMNGHVAAAGSTGGLEGKHVGRVGDTPLPGAGLYADDEMGAAAFSGEGESIARGMLAAHALYGLSASSPLSAASACIQRVAERIGGEVGAIVIAPDGRMGAAHNSPQFSLGLAASWIDAAHSGVDAKELTQWLE